VPPAPRFEGNREDDFDRAALDRKGHRRLSRAVALQRFGDLRWK
jgi:hypothetical protein